MQLDRLVHGSAMAALVGLVAIVPATIGLAHSPRLKAMLGLSDTFNVPYAIGEPVDLPPTFFDSADVTVIFLSRASCSGCVASKPAFAKLVQASKGRGNARAIIVTYGPHTDDEVAFARDIGLTSTSLLRYASAIRARVTPTILIVDRTGHILGVHEGRPSESAVADLENILRQ